MRRGVGSAWAIVLACTLLVTPLGCRPPPKPPPFGTYEHALAVAKEGDGTWTTIDDLSRTAGDVKSQVNRDLTQSDLEHLRTIAAEIDSTLVHQAELRSLGDAIAMRQLVDDHVPPILDGAWRVDPASLRAEFVNDLATVTHDAVTGVACDLFRTAALGEFSSADPGDERLWTGNLRDAALSALGRWAGVETYVDLVLWADDVRDAGTDVYNAVAVDQTVELQLIRSPGVREVGYQYYKICHGPPPL